MSEALFQVPSRKAVDDAIGRLAVAFQRQIDAGEVVRLGHAVPADAYGPKPLEVLAQLGDHASKDQGKNQYALYGY